MDRFYILFLLIILYSKKGLSTQDIEMTSSHIMPVKEGDRVILSCKLSGVKNRETPFIFKRHDTMISENCIAFEKKYILNCTNKNEYKLTIKSMTWEERGEWFCLYTSILKNISLEVYVSPSMSIKIEAIPKQIISPNVGSEALPIRHVNYASVNGRGSELNPFDLRNELSVHLICRSGCGYPLTYHAFNFRNSSNFSLQLNDNSFVYENKSCGKNLKIKMFYAISTLELNCSAWNLYGLLNLTFAAVDTTHKSGGIPMTIAEDHIFILCPTKQIEWWKMTYGERINTGIGCFIGVMLILYLFLLVCRWKSNKYNDIDDPCQGVLTSGNNDSTTYKGRGYRV